MKRACGFVVTFLLAFPVQARNQSKESKRLEEAPLDRSTGYA
jgi:hypothetical protein